MEDHTDEQWKETVSKLNAIRHKVRAICRQITQTNKLLIQIQQNRNTDDKLDSDITKLQEQVIQLTQRIENLVEEKRDLVDIQLQLLEIKIDLALKMQLNATQ